jgi:hypothetical protein
MIEQHEVLQALVDACPSFSKDAQEHVAEYGNDLLYVAAGAFARHLLVLQEEGHTSSLQGASSAIEHLHIQGSPWVREFATIGLLEGVQNTWTHSGTDPELFAQYLGPESARWWISLNNFWSGTAAHAEGEA